VPERRAAHTDQGKRSDPGRDESRSSLHVPLLLAGRE
jgi:hypothetical protein